MKNLLLALVLMIGLGLIAPRSDAQLRPTEVVAVVNGTVTQSVQHPENDLVVCQAYWTYNAFAVVPTIWIQAFKLVQHPGTNIPDALTPLIDVQMLADYDGMFGHQWHNSYPVAVNWQNDMVGPTTISYIFKLFVVYGSEATLYSITQFPVHWQQ